MERLYADLVWLYPQVSDRDAYAAEAAQISRAIRRKLPSISKRRKPTLLELGVGAGHLLSHLTDAFEAVAVDLVPEMLEYSRSINPGVEHVVGDMKTVRLGRMFDATMIHDAIHYMLTEEDLLAAMRTCHAHLQRSGVAVFVPGYVKETFLEGDVSHALRLHADGELGYIAQAHDPDPTDDTYQLNFLLPRREGMRIIVEEDRHTCGLFPTATWMRLLDEAGFDARKPRTLSGRSGSPSSETLCMFVAVRR
jgi:hypothetical protein